jgi:hypothetical protein
MRKVVLLLSLLISTVSFADEAFVGMGLGAFNTAKGGPGSVKLGQFGHRLDLIDGFYWQNKVGGWGQGGNAYGMESSGYAASGIGFRVELEPLDFHAGYSLCGITNTDAYLGGHFQFNGEAYLGLRDRHGNGFGLKYEHISSAGIEMPNQGRDFFILELSQRWW